MSEIKSTRLRFIRAKDETELTQFVDKLPFKIEIKQILKTGSTWIIYFVIPDNIQFQSVDLS